MELINKGRFIVRAVFRVTPEQGVEINLFSGRLVKSFIMVIKGFEPLRKFYSSKGFKPFRVTPLHTCVTGAVVRGYVGAGERLCFEVSYVTSDLGEVQVLASVDERVRLFNTTARLEAINVELVSPSNLSIGFRNPKAQIIKMVFDSPVLLSTKLMTPPIPEFQRKVSKARPLYVLFPSPAHICSYLVKLWAEAFPETPLAPLYTQEWAAYLFGRLCEVTTAPIDYSIKPVTVAYDENRRIRGFTGWVLIDVIPIGKRHVERLDKLFALANYLGIGKSRGIGFGKARITTVERKTKS